MSQTGDGAVNLALRSRETTVRLGRERGGQTPTATPNRHPFLKNMRTCARSATAFDTRSYAASRAPKLLSRSIRILRWGSRFAPASIGLSRMIPAMIASFRSTPVTRRDRLRLRLPNSTALVSPTLWSRWRIQRLATCDLQVWTGHITSTVRVAARGATRRLTLPALPLPTRLPACENIRPTHRGRMGS